MKRIIKPNFHDLPVAQQVQRLADLIVWADECTVRCRAQAYRSPEWQELNKTLHQLRIQIGRGITQLPDQPIAFRALADELERRLL
jgi:hypothetical protein